MKMKPSLLQLSLMMIAFFGLLAAVTFAQEPKADRTGTGQISHPDIRILALETSADVDMAISANAASATFGSLTLTVQVDTKYCATGGVQCTGPGLTTVAPADNNRNPVRLGLQVLQGTTPVSNLTDAEVTVLNSFVPAGGAAVSQLSCGACFQNAGNGMYAIFVNPGVGQTWKPGSYFVQIQVKVGVETHRALAQIEIPF
jgi:hypothetical protein